MTQGHRLTRRLALHSFATLLAFALLIGAVFAFLFTRYHEEMHRQELQQRAETIAAALPAMDGAGMLLASPDVPMEENAAPVAWQHSRKHGCGMMRWSMHGKGMSETGDGESVPRRNPHGMTAHEWCRRSYSNENLNAANDARIAAFLHQLNELAQGEVWVVSADSREISSFRERSEDTERDKNAANDGMSIGSLPEGADTVLQEVLAGGTAVSDAFTPILGTASVTAGAPVLDADGKVRGAVLLHRPLRELRHAELRGLSMLGASLLLGLVLAGMLATLLARHFIRPLYRMKDTAQAFATGDFSGRTGVRQPDEIGMLAESIDTLGERLGAAERERETIQQQRQDFLSAVSHELRTPLTVLRGTWELLQSGIVTDAAKRQGYEQQMMGSISALERLVDDLLELTRLRNPGFQIEKQFLDIAEVCRDAARAARALAEQKGIVLDTDIADSLPFEGDFGRLRQLLLILLDNAIKFSPEGSMVTLRAHPHGAGWQVVVEDRGCGIAPEELPHIFERFRTKREGNEGGTGLGLAIAQEIASRHSATLRCESNPGAGTRFYLETAEKPIFR